MSKKIVVISSSPRKYGNSDTLCDEFNKGAKDAGHETEKIFLGDKYIKSCTGCGLCFTQQGTCSQKDDMQEIRDKMVDADVIVMATPVYFYAMTGQLKTFVDRNCFFHTLLQDKEFYFILTAADKDTQAMEGTMKEFEGYLSCLDGSKQKGVLKGIGLFGKDDVRSTSYMKEAYDMGKMV